jgi:hypothetical protein
MSSCVVASILSLGGSLEHKLPQIRSAHDAMVQDEKNSAHGIEKEDTAEEEVEEA